MQCAPPKQHKDICQIRLFATLCKTRFPGYGKTGRLAGILGSKNACESKAPFCRSAVHLTSTLQHRYTPQPLFWPQPGPSLPHSPAFICPWLRHPILHLNGAYPWPPAPAPSAPERHYHHPKHLQHSNSKNYYSHASCVCNVTAPDEGRKG